MLSLEETWLDIKRNEYETMQRMKKEQEEKKDAEQWRNEG